MSLVVDDKQTETEMTERLVVEDSRGWRQQQVEQEMNDDRQLIDGMMECTIGVTMTSDVNNDRADQSLIL